MRSVFPLGLLATLLAIGSRALPPAGAEEPPAIKAPVPAKAKEAGPADETEVRALLRQKPKFEAGEGGTPMQQILKLLSSEHGLTVRLDLAAFKRFRSNDGAAAAGPAQVFVVFRAPAAPDEFQPFYDAKIRLSITASYTLGDLLTDLCAQLPGKCAYRVRHNQVLIGPAFAAPTIPGSGVNNETSAPLVPQNVLVEQLFGEPVSVALEDKPLTDAVAELRKITGANIVLDARTKDKAKQVVSGTFDDARLLTVLELLADMCELKVVSNNNVFYITSVENAAKMQKRISRDLFGPETLPPSPNIGGSGLPGPGLPSEPKK